MSLIKCSECDHEISDKAKFCISCGFPLDKDEETETKQSLGWHTASKARTPINIFALAMMCCASILGGSATFVDTCQSQTAFTYTIHAFLAVSGMFFLTILFCRKGVYHPEDLDKVSPEVREELGADKPHIAAALIAAMMFAYGAYQFNTDPPCTEDTSKMPAVIEQVSRTENAAL
ncbi:MAG: zinc ribbon domain-containing protein [Motiliproteus sp.]|nr:zinc ribbon domain-containing protein [Motiliproteus sp.]MCW9052031.1 zinc ribbon domain-containing protein [Motiliproteus sp.]